MRMDNFKINIGSPHGTEKGRSFPHKFKQHISKIATRPLAEFLVLAIAGALIAFLTARSGISGGLLVLIPTIAIILVYAIIVFPKFGVIFLLLAAYIIMWIAGMLSVDFPFGTLMDGLEFLLIIGFFIKQKRHSNWQLFKEPVGIIILIWVAYNVLEFANPTAESRLAWVYTIRSVAVVMLMYFIFGYHIDSTKFIRTIFKLWLGLACFAALYAYKQEYIGFFPYEERILSDPRVHALYFINGHWRKTSIFSDPVAFAYNMVMPCIFCITMLLGPLQKWKKIVLGGLALFFFQAMLFSGTRGAYVLVPVALVLLSILMFNRRVLLFGIMGALFFAFLVYVPTSNPNIRRFQTAFRPSDDASFNVRKENQKRIQPFIQTHPFGGGLGATGVWGARFSPHSFLARFPPDSGYVRVAVELGSIGLLLICTLMFIIITIGIINFYRIKDPELKIYCLAMTLIIFAYAVGNYPQEAIVQFPSNIYFYLFAALITVTYQLDRKKQNKSDEEKT